jgi:hypothetical protein
MFLWLNRQELEKVKVALESTKELQLVEKIKEAIIEEDGLNRFFLEARELSASENDD